MHPYIKDGYLAWAESLGASHGGAGIAERIGGSFIGARACGDADAGAGEHLSSIHEKRFGEFRLEPLRDAQRVTHVLDIVEQQGKFISAKARDRVAGSHLLNQSLGNFDQHLISGRLPKTRIDGLKAVQIDGKDGKQVPSPPLHLVETTLCTVQEQGAVG